MRELFSSEDSEQLERILTLVRDERAYQDWKYGTSAQRFLGLGDYLVILRGELEEAEQAFRKGRSVDGCLDEILQVAAVAVAAMQQHERGREMCWPMRGQTQTQLD